MSAAMFTGGCHYAIKINDRHFHYDGDEHNRMTKGEMFRTP